MGGSRESEQSEGEEEEDIEFADGSVLTLMEGFKLPLRNSGARGQHFVVLDLALPMSKTLRGLLFLLLCEHRSVCTWARH